METEHRTPHDNCRSPEQLAPSGAAYVWIAYGWIAYVGNAYVWIVHACQRNIARSAPHMPPTGITPDG